MLAKEFLGNMLADSLLESRARMNVSVYDLLPALEEAACNLVQLLNEEALEGIVEGADIDALNLNAEQDEMEVTKYFLYSYHEGDENHKRDVVAWQVIINCALNRVNELRGDID